MRTIQQVESAECALACLAMIADYFGYRVELSHLRASIGPSLKGSSLSQIMAMAKTLCLNTRPVKAEMSELSSLRLPCMLHWNDSHFVVLKKIRRRDFEIVDPANGLKAISRAEFSDHFTGVAIEFSPRAEFKKADLREKMDYRRLFGKIIGLKRGVAQLVLMTILLEICGLISPLFSKWMFDEVLPAQDVSLFWVLTSGFLLILVTRLVIQYGRTLAIIALATQFSTQWGTNLLDKLLSIPLPYFEKRRAADINSRFSSFHVIQKQLTTGLAEIAIDGMMTVLSLAALLILDKTLASIVILATVLYGVSRAITYKYISSLKEQSIVLASQQQAHMLETIQGIFAIRIANREYWRLLHWQNLFVDEINSGVKQQKCEARVSFVNNGLSGLKDVLTLAVAILMIISNNFTVGDLVAFGTYAAVFSNRTNSLIDRFVEIKLMRIHADRIADFALLGDEETPSFPNEGGFSKLAETPTIELKNVSFRYAEGEELVLENVSFKIEPGESIAIIGKSGVGKTTLLKILLGIYQPTEGEILIDGIPLKRFGIRRFREMVSSVMQHDTLFNGSIAENISFYDEQADFEKIKNSATMASIDIEIEKMQMRYQTRVGDQGAALSGGQRQRVLLARAFYKKPKLFLLDEATSHLDIGNEAFVNESIRAVNATRIFVAHRPDTIRSADRIIDLSARAADIFPIRA